MILAVVDANVVASGIVGQMRPESTPAAVIRRWYQGDFELISSEPLVLEVERTLGKPYFRRLLSRREVEEALLRFRQRARIVGITVTVSGVATHPEDDLVLATALSAPAPYLVTGHVQLQKLGQYEIVRIVSPAEFLRILNAS